MTGSGSRFGIIQHPVFGYIPVFGNITVFGFIAPLSVAFNVPVLVILREKTRTLFVAPFLSPVSEISPIFMSDISPACTVFYSGKCL